MAAAAAVKMMLMLIIVLVVVVAAGGGGMHTSLPHHSRRKRSPVHPHARLRTDELIRVRGYPAETHEVKTEDGYILTLHRIPHGRHASHPNAHIHSPSQSSLSPVSSSLSSVHNLHSGIQHLNSFSHNPHSNAPHLHSNIQNQHIFPHNPHSNSQQRHSFHRAPPPHKSHTSHPIIQNIHPIAALDRRPPTHGNNAPIHLPRPLSQPRLRRSMVQTPENGTEYASERGSMTHNRVKRSGRKGMKNVVFILHGILSSSADFVLNDPDQALAFLLADAGYDVWLGNIRGNFYGRRHVTLSPDDPRFWDYSWNEVAQYDLPAMLSYVRAMTGVPMVKYVGHSMGASLLFATLHYHPHINSWIRATAAMAPAAYMHNKQGPHRLLAPFINEFDKGLRRSGIHELLPLQENRAEWSVLCNPSSPVNSLCSLTYFIINGPNSNYVDKNYLPVIAAHTPAGTGLRIFTQLMQIVHAARFQAFDYGPERNLKEYGRTTPPRYLLSRVTNPVGIFYSDNDWVVDPKDIAITASELPNLVLNYRVPLADFNHVDFLWAENAAHLVYRPVLNFLKDF